MLIPSQQRFVFQTINLNLASSKHGQSCPSWLSALSLGDILVCSTLLRAANSYQRARSSFSHFVALLKRKGKEKRRNLRSYGEVKHAEIVLFPVNLAK